MLQDLRFTIILIEVNVLVRLASQSRNLPIFSLRVASEVTKIPKGMLTKGFIRFGSVHEQQKDVSLFFRLVESRCCAAGINVSSKK